MEKKLNLKSMKVERNEMKLKLRRGWGMHDLARAEYYLIFNCYFRMVQAAVDLITFKVIE